MKRFSFLLKVKEDKMAEYKAAHQAVWPEMLDAIRRAGYHNYSLFMAENGMLFGYFETHESLQTVGEAMSKEEVNTRWQTYMADFFEGIGGKHADEGMVSLEEVLYLE